MALTHYRELVVWQKAMDLAGVVHLASRNFPRDEIFSLTNQLRRASVSIPSNVAEGQGRGSTKEFLQFLRIANGSLQEAETQLILAGRFEYLSEPELRDLLNRCGEVGRINHGPIRSLLSR